MVSIHAMAEIASGLDSYTCSHALHYELSHVGQLEYLQSCLSYHYYTMNPVSRLLHELLETVVLLMLLSLIHI